MLISATPEATPDNCVAGPGMSTGTIGPSGVQGVLEDVGLGRVVPVAIG